jgi:hypothetical protein
MKTNVVDGSEGAGRAFPDRGPKLGNAIFTHRRCIEASGNAHAPVALNSARPQTPPPPLVKSLGRNANLDTSGDSLSRKSPSESNEPITSSYHIAAPPMHLPGDPPYWPPTVSWIPTGFAQDKRDGQPLDNREILNKDETFASQTSGMQTAQSRNQISNFESHANRRYDPIKENPLPVFHHPDMEALSIDDMIDISFMADVFFAAHSWEFSYRLCRREKGKS